MKLLTITKEGQGKRSNDFCLANEGEIVRFGTICEREPIDGSCGCRRSLVGLDSWKSSTTVVVRDLNITPEELTLRIANYYREAWKISVKEAMAYANEEVEQLESFGKHFPVGRVLEIRGDTVQVR